MEAEKPIPTERPCGVRLISSLLWVLTLFGLVAGLWLLLGNETDLVQETLEVTADQAEYAGWAVLAFGAIAALLAIGMRGGWGWVMWVTAALFAVYAAAALWYLITQDGTDRLNALLHLFLALLGLYWTVGDRAREFYETN